MLEMIFLLTLPADGERFFDRGEVDFWGTRGKPAAPPGPWVDPSAPEPVRRLVADPTPGNARAYLDWQSARLRRLRAAIEAVELEKRGDLPPLLYFARAGCRYCELQERELAGLPVTRVPGGSPLWKEYDVRATPTLVARGRVFRGLTPRAALVEELRRD